MVTFLSNFSIELSLFFSPCAKILGFLGDIRTGANIGAFLKLIKQL